MEITAPKSYRRRWTTDCFWGLWILSASLGTVLGLLAVRISASALGDGLLELCTGALISGHFSAPSLLISTSFFFFLMLLCSQLPGGMPLVMVLTGLKLFCTAYVFGAFFLLRQTPELSHAMLPLFVHTLLQLPAFYLLAALSCRCRLTGRGMPWFRYRGLPLLLLYGYLVLLSFLSGAIRAAF